MSFVLRAFVVVAVLTGCLLPSATSHAAAPRAGVSVPGLTLRVAPIVDVGTSVTFSLYARKWPASGKASIRFVSPSHGFSGSMLWDVTCRCFRLAVPLGRRIHPLEVAHAFAQVRFAARSQGTGAKFSIRGLAPDRKHYAPGGTPLLTTWIGDPRPTRDMVQHFCAWVHASDAFGFSGVRVRFVVAYLPKAQELVAQTSVTGLACARRAVGSAPIGVRVRVDAYAGKLHGVTSFTPRA